MEWNGMRSTESTGGGKCEGRKEGCLILHLNVSVHNIHSFRILVVKHSKRSRLPKSTQHHDIAQYCRTKQSS